MIGGFKIAMLIAAGVLFLLAAVGVTHPRYSLTAAGLALWVFSLLLQ